MMGEHIYIDMPYGIKKSPLGAGYIVTQFIPKGEVFVTSTRSLVAAKKIVSLMLDILSIQHEDARGNYDHDES